MIRSWATDDVLWDDIGSEVWSALFRAELRAMPQLELEELARALESDPDACAAAQELAWRETL